MNLRTEVALNKEAILAKLLIAENYYKSLEKLHFVRNANKIRLRRDNTAESFVRKFFTKFNNEYLTVFDVSGNTYCSIDTRRSIGDVFRLAYCYLGNKITLKDIVIHTYNTIKESELTGNFCYQINKRVYKFREAKNGTFYDPGYMDELGLTQAHYELLN